MWTPVCSNRGTQGTGGGRVKGPLGRHLEELEAQVHEWLHRAQYELADSDTKRDIRKKAMVPRLDAEMPEAYRLWRTCDKYRTLFWPGGLGNQPHILMLEFSVCNAAYLNYHQRNPALGNLPAEPEIQWPSGLVPPRNA